MLFNIQLNIDGLVIKNFKSANKNQVQAKKWLSPKSDAFEALQNIVLDKKVLEDLSYLTKFCHTGVLESYHSLYNKWAPKGNIFRTLVC